MRFHLFVLLLPLFMITAPLNAQRDPVVRAGIDVRTITVGDRATLTVTVQHDTTSRVGWPDTLQSLGSLEVLEVRISDPTRVDGTLESRAQIVLTAFELGELEIPSVQLSVANESGESSTVQTEPIGINVVSVGQDEGGDIRDIKPPLAIPRNWLLVAVWLFAGAALIVVAWWLYRRFLRGREATEPATSLAPPRPPHEIAFEALDALANSDLLERGDVKQYHIEISEIIRTYLEGRYGIPAMEMTSEDVLWELQRDQLRETVYDRLSEFFVRCDLVKFAKSRPNVQASRELMPVARAIVDQTKQVWEMANVS